MLRPKWVSFWPFSKVYKERIVEHVLLLVSAKRIAELLFQEPHKEQGQQSLKSIDISGNCARSCSLGFTRAALLDDALLHHGC